MEAKRWRTAGRPSSSSLNLRALVGQLYQFQITWAGPWSMVEASADHP
jgi:hypothetical protein